MTDSSQKNTPKRNTLTELQIRQIRNFRGRGFTLAQTAEALKLPISTVKTYCYRHPEQLFTLTNDAESCRQCGKPLKQTAGQKKRKFCCKHCRLQWWSEHRDCYSVHPQEPTTCKHCGIQFFGVRHGQKFCSHDCYIHHRFYSEDAET